jgi:hypothetical protein
LPDILTQTEKVYSCQEGLIIGREDRLVAEGSTGDNMTAYQQKPKTFPHFHKNECLQKSGCFLGLLLPLYI